ncbi:MAG: hypothetical protein LBJ70_02615 [Holosporales bacterium]|nr:hypothetical protein [Holosporales bacterium]
MRNLRSFLTIVVCCVTLWPAGGSALFGDKDISGGLDALDRCKDKNDLVPMFLSICPFSQERSFLIQVAGAFPYGDLPPLMEKATVVAENPIFGGSRTAFLRDWSRVSDLSSVGQLITAGYELRSVESQILQDAVEEKLDKLRGRLLLGRDLEVRRTAALEILRYGVSYKGYDETRRVALIHFLEDEEGMRFLEQAIQGGKISLNPMEGEMLHQLRWKPILSPRPIPLALTYEPPSEPKVRVVSPVAEMDLRVALPLAPALGGGSPAVEGLSLVEGLRVQLPRLMAVPYPVAVSVSAFPALQGGSFDSRGAVADQRETDPSARLLALTWDGEKVSESSEGVSLVPSAVKPEGRSGADQDGDVLSTRPDLIDRTEVLHDSQRVVSSVSPLPLTPVGVASFPGGIPFASSHGGQSGRFPFGLLDAFCASKGQGKSDSGNPLVSSKHRRKDSEPFPFSFNGGWGQWGKIEDPHEEEMDEEPNPLDGAETTAY